jgi:hypothetical protein
MSEVKHKTDHQRIIVGLRSSSDIDKAMAAATVLANVIEAEIVGLLVQDQAMLDLVEFPFAQVLDFDKPSPRKVSLQLMQESMTRTESVCRRVLSNYARKAQVRWSFSTETGEFNASVKALTSLGDFVVLTGETHGMGTRFLTDSLRRLPKHINGVIVAALHRNGFCTGPVVAVDDGDEIGSQTVAFAARIAAIKERPLHLFVIAASNAEATRIVDRASRLSSKVRSLILHRFVPGVPQSVAAGLAHLSPSFVVGELNGETFKDDKIAVLLFRAARAPVLLLRTQNQE